MFISPLMVAQFVEHHIPQMVQALSQLNRVDQGPAGPVVAVVAGQVGPGDQKGCDCPAVVSDPDFVQPGAHAQQKCALEQIGDFNGTFQKDPTSFQLIVFFGEMR
jgi:hypothetical protein